MDTHAFPTCSTETIEIQAIANEMMKIACARESHHGTIAHDSFWQRTCEDTGFIRIVTIKESPDRAQVIEECWSNMMTDKGHPPGRRQDALIAFCGTGP